jgi:DNA-binding MarR family transcriptional regulator
MPPELVDRNAGPDAWPLGRLLSAAARSVERQWDERLRQIDLTHAAVIVLDHVVTSGEAGAEALATAAHVQPQTMSKTLDRMERDGLVERLPDPADRRRRIVRPTPRGRSAWDSARHVEREVLPDDPALRAALLAVLQR